MDWVRRLVRQCRSCRASQAAAPLVRRAGLFLAHPLDNRPWNAGRPERSILFPSASEPDSEIWLWPDVVSSAQAIGLLSSAERTLLRAISGVSLTREELVGVGVEPVAPASVPPSSTRSRRRAGLGRRGIRAVR
jgi:hypothetical protein